ncbi:hypothetical protein [Providencia rettgeri]|uniref:hypothetical protein n=1 Tax=Providencia rettgeri TaxID=587 RepID=UPI001B38ABDC|nr:hypothetical protein [Providencia rettgeri]MBQ0367840.1 hypothetical protein [Providencia rettgeri]
MKTLNEIQWLGECPKCEHASAQVQTENGREYWLYAGDKVTCENCKHTGVVEADGECAWCEWDEVNEQH